MLRSHTFYRELDGSWFIDNTEWCREKLGIPYGTRGKVRPLQIPDVMNKYDIYVQSNSYTRKLDPGTKFLY